MVAVCGVQALGAWVPVVVAHGSVFRLVGSRLQAEWLWCPSLAALQRVDLLRPGIEPLSPALQG